MRLYAFPYPHDDVFGGWVFDEIIERLMVEQIDGFAAHDLLDRIEIFDHPARRAVALNWAANGDFEAIGVAVHPGTFAGVERKNVGRLKAEVSAYLHGETKARVRSSGARFR